MQKFNQSDTKFYSAVFKETLSIKITKSSDENYLHLLMLPLKSICFILNIQDNTNINITNRIIYHSQLNVAKSNMNLNLQKLTNNYLLYYIIINSSINTYYCQNKKISF
jgi:hypothetical protein